MVKDYTILCDKCKSQCSEWEHFDDENKMDLGIAVTLSLVTAVVVGVVQVAKTLGLPTRFAPLLAVVVGVLIVLGLSLFQATFSVILTGVVVGLSAVGLFSGVRATVGK